MPLTSLTVSDRPMRIQAHTLHCPSQDSAQADSILPRVGLQAYGVGPASSDVDLYLDSTTFFMWKLCEAVDSVEPAAAAMEVVSMCGYRMIFFIVLILVLDPRGTEQSYV